MKYYYSVFRDADKNGRQQWGYSITYGGTQVRESGKRYDSQAEASLEATRIVEQYNDNLD